MSQTIKQHSISYTASVAKRAASDVTHFLQTAWSDQTIAVHNVEDDHAYQKLDIDLLWSVIQEGELRIIPIEIKGDRYHKTGNFFFETISNASKNTPGCFLYTKAHWLLYYFVEVGTLYCLPMNVVRPWFLKNINQFRERRTSTPVGQESYITVGRLVPIKTAQQAIPQILKFQKEGARWVHAP